MQRFTDLRVWQRSHALVLEIYRLSSNFPREERYGLTSQLRGPRPQFQPILRKGPGGGAVRNMPVFSILLRGLLRRLNTSRF